MTQDPTTVRDLSVVPSMRRRLKRIVAMSKGPSVFMPDMRPMSLHSKRPLQHPQLDRAIMRPLAYTSLPSLARTLILPSQ